MANINPSRMTPAEIRRKLQAPPVEPLHPEPEATVPVWNLAKRSGGGHATTDSMKLDTLQSLSMEHPESAISDLLRPMVPNGSSRTTPLPEMRLDASSFRPNVAGGMPGDASAGDDDLAYEIAKLREENEDLRRMVLELQPLAESADKHEDRFASMELAFADDLTAKDRQIAELQDQLRMIEEQLSEPMPASAPLPKNSDELEEWSDELEKESARLAQKQRQIDEDRKQLREDEESLEKQMRDMEVSMARERAMLARQEVELKRLSIEIQQELEMMQRGDGALRDQLAKFQRRHQDVLSRSPGGASGPAMTAPPPPPISSPTSSGTQTPSTSKGPELSGLKRLFRR